MSCLQAVLQAYDFMSRSCSLYFYTPFLFQASCPARTSATRCPLRSEERAASALRNATPEVQLQVRTSQQSDMFQSRWPSTPRCLSTDGDGGPFFEKKQDGVPSCAIEALNPL